MPATLLLRGPQFVAVPLIAIFTCLDPLRAFVAAHYRLTAAVAGWSIYVSRDEPAQ